MASSLHNQLKYDLVCFGSIYSDTQRRGSKSQMCLHKILHIITTVPPLTTAESSPFSGSEIKESSAENDTSDENKGSGFDLNVEFSVSPEMEESFSGFSSSSTTVRTGGGPAVINDGALKVNRENGCDRVEKEKPDENRVEKTEKLSLLIEAAKLIFGEFEDDNKSESKVKKGEMAANEENERRLRRQSIRSSSLAAEEMGEVLKATAPSSPVIRSKRARITVLPNKYKDSVLEPLTRLSRNRSSIMPTKRRQR